MQCGIHFTVSRRIWSFQKPRILDCAKNTGSIGRPGICPSAAHGLARSEGLQANSDTSRQRFHDGTVSLAPIGRGRCPRKRPSLGRHDVARRRALALQTVARCPLCGLDYATSEEENIGCRIRTDRETKRMDALLWCCGAARNGTGACSVTCEARWACPCRHTCTEHSPFGRRAARCGPEMTFGISNRLQEEAR